MFDLFSLQANSVSVSRQDRVDLFDEECERIEHSRRDTQRTHGKSVPYLIFL